MNSKRLMKNRNGDIFMPMNVEGGTWNEHFITTGKLIWIAILAACSVVMYMWLASTNASVFGYFIFTLGFILIASLVVRYVIFEERYYYKLYQKMKDNEIGTPAIFWNIASIKETNEGCILIYADARVGVMFRLERDTITGKDEEFREEHYDSISNFYKEIANKKYSMVQMNIMEQAGNDPRLYELDKLIKKNSNPNIQNLMEQQIGYIKNITRKTLFETEYFLIYTEDLTKTDQIIEDVVDIAFKAMDGAYIGYSILHYKDIIEFEKDLYNIKYFDCTEATLEMFKRNGIYYGSPFKLTGVVFDNDEEHDINEVVNQKIAQGIESIKNGTKDISSLKIREFIRQGEKRKEKFEGVRFSELGGESSNNSEKEYSKVEKMKGKTINRHRDIHSQSAVKKKEISRDEKISQQKKSHSVDLQLDIEDDEKIDF